MENKVNYILTISFMNLFNIGLLQGNPKKNVF